MKKNKFEIDMCNGSIMDKLISFSLPLMLTSILQLMFNAVDIIVVGRFSGSQALAAVGSTTALINIFTNLFIGISLGANVLAARYYAAGRDKEMSEAVHTAIALAFVSGIIMAFVGVGASRFALELMDTPADVIDQSVLYMRIYFMGMPFFMLYNYGGCHFKGSGGYKAASAFPAGGRNDQRGAGSAPGYRDPFECGRSGYRNGSFPDDLLYPGALVSTPDRRKLSASFFKAQDPERISETYFPGGDTCGGSRAR